MDRSLAELQEIVRKRVCTVCSEREMNPTCGPENPGRCVLFSKFPLVAEAIQSTNSDHIEDYLEAIRRNVCAACARENGGSCVTPLDVQCALETYLLLVVEAIEEATGKNFGRPLPNRPAPVSVQL